MTHLLQKTDRKDVTKIEKDRRDNKTSKFAAVLMMRQFGVLVGPIMIYVLPKMAFTADIGSWTLEVSQYSAAGLLLGQFLFYSL